jgi:hypothetical protein
MNVNNILAPTLRRGSALPRRSGVGEVLNNVRQGVIMSRLIPIILVILIGTAIPTYGSEPEKKPTDKEIKALIDKLVSPNPKPITGDEDPKEAPDYRLPPGFDREKQEVVHEALDDLEGLQTQAFPFLIERWNDNRYCITISEGLNGYCRNQTVGKTCKMIVFDQIQPYGNWQGVDSLGLKYVWRPSYPAEFLASKEDAKKWHEKRKNKSLFEIQLEVLDWVIAEEAKVPKLYEDKEREFLQKTRKELVERKKPIARGHYYCIDIEQ